MKRFVVSLSALTMLVLSVPAGAAERQAEKKPKSQSAGCYLDPLELANSGKGDTTVSAAVVVGRTIVISLKCTPPAAIWSLRNGKIEGDAVEQVGRAKRVIIRRGGKRVGEKYFFTFRAVKPGQAKLVLEYKRAWEKDKPPLETFTLTATVKPDPTADRVRKIKADVKNFTLTLHYRGPQGGKSKGKLRPRSLVLSVPQMVVDAVPGFNYLTISGKQAGKIIDHLASEGFFARSVDTSRMKMKTPKGPAYTLRVGCSRFSLLMDLGWDLKMLKRLDGLRKVLDGEAARAMDRLIKRFGGHRRKWENAQGVKGKAVKLTGNFMPGIGGPPGGRRTPMSVPVWVFKGKVKPFKKPDRKHPALVKVVRSGKDGTYRVALPPGEYTIVSEIGGRLYLNSYDGVGFWSTEMVEKSRWTEFDLVDSSEAVY